LHGSLRSIFKARFIINKNRVQPQGQPAQSPIFILQIIVHCLNLIHGKHISKYPGVGGENSSGQSGDLWPDSIDAGRAGRRAHCRLGDAWFAGGQRSTLASRHRCRGLVRLPEFEGKAVQVMLLRQEGVEVDRRGRIDLERFQWVPE